VLALATRTPGVSRPVSALELQRTDGDPAVIPTLSRLVARESNPRIRRIAMMGLARTSSQDAIPALLSGLDVDDDATRVWAARGLGKLKAREGLPGLIPLLENRRLRHEAAQALLAIRDTRAVQPMRQAARHGMPWTRSRLRRQALQLAKAVGERD
jgi:HEAT repeat protein